MDDDARGPASRQDPDKLDRWALGAVVVGAIVAVALLLLRLLT